MALYSYSVLRFSTLYTSSSSSIRYKLKQRWTGEKNHLGERVKVLHEINNTAVVNTSSIIKREKKKRKENIREEHRMNNSVSSSEFRKNTFKWTTG